MALINCPDCSYQHSDRAKACPKCGCPVERHELPDPYLEQGKYRESRYVTTQQTDKSWKLLKLIGMLTGLLFTVLTVANLGKETSQGFILIAVLGVVVWLVGSIGSWWSNA